MVRVLRDGYVYNTEEFYDYWDGRNEQFQPVDPGVYVLKIVATDAIDNKTSRQFTFYVSDDERPLDSVPPVTTLSYALSEGQYESFISRNNSFILNAMDVLNVPDEISTGVKQIHFKLIPERQDAENIPFKIYQEPINYEGINSFQLTYKAEDDFGNVETAKTMSFYVDELAPTTTISARHEFSMIEGQKYFDPEWDFQLNTIEEGAGVKSTFYRVNGGEYVEYVEPFTLSEGRFVIDYYSVDNVNNVEEGNSMTLISPIPDVTPPITTLNFEETPKTVIENQAYIVSANEVELTAVDEVGINGYFASGVIELDYQIDSGSIQTLDGSSVSFNFEEGVKVIKYQARDLAGNQEELKSYTVVIDDTSPDVFISGVPLNYFVNTPITPSIIVTDENLKSYLTTLNDVEFTVGDSIANDGVYRLKVFAEDKSGNATSRIVEFEIDTQKPKIIFNAPDEGKYLNTSVTPEVTISDKNLNSVTYALNGSVYDLTEISEEGEYELKVKAVDKAGNMAIESISFVIDKTPPVIKIDNVTEDGEYEVGLIPAIVITDKYLDSKTIKLNGEIFENGSSIDLHGPYTLSVTAKDKAGSITTYSLSFTILKPDRTPPEILFENITNNEFLNTSLTPDITITDESDFTATYRLNGRSYTLGTAISKEAIYTLTVTAIDEHKNSAKESITFTIDKTAPVILVQGIPKQPYSTVSVKPVIEIIEENLKASSITLNGQPFTNGTTINKNGKYTLVVTAEDLAGQKAEVSHNFHIDKAIPTVLLTGPNAKKEEQIYLPGVTADLVMPPFPLLATPQETKGPFRHNFFHTAGSVTAGKALVWIDIDKSKTSFYVLNQGRLRANFHIYADKNLQTLIGKAYVRGKIAGVNSPQVFQNPPSGKKVGELTWNINIQESEFKRYLINLYGEKSTYRITQTFLDKDFATSKAGRQANSFKDGYLTLWGADGYTNGDYDQSKMKLGVDIVFDTYYTGNSATFPWRSWDIGSKIDESYIHHNGQAYKRKTPITEEGRHTITAYVKDKAGNLGSDSMSFTIDGTAPMISVTGVQNNGVYQTLSEARQIQVVIDDATLDQTQILLNKQLVSNAINVSAEGEYLLEIKAVDKVRNQSIETIQFKIDNTLPILLLRDIINGDQYSEFEFSPQILEENLDITSSYFKLNEVDYLPLFQSRLVDGETLWEAHLKEYGKVGENKLTYQIRDLASNEVRGELIFTVDAKAVLPKEYREDFDTTNDLVALGYHTQKDTSGFTIQDQSLTVKATGKPKIQADITTPAFNLDRREGRIVFSHKLSMREVDANKVSAGQAKSTEVKIHLTDIEGMPKYSMLLKKRKKNERGILYQGAFIEATRGIELKTFHLESDIAGDISLQWVLDRPKTSGGTGQISLYSKRPGDRKYRQILSFEEASHTTFNSIGFVYQTAVVERESIRAQAEQAINFVWDQVSFDELWIKHEVGDGGYEEDFVTTETDPQKLGFSYPEAGKAYFMIENESLKTKTPGGSESPAIIESPNFKVSRSEKDILFSYKLRFPTNNIGRTWREQNQVSVSLLDEQGNKLYTLLFKPSGRSDLQKGFDLELRKNDESEKLKEAWTRKITPVGQWVKFRWAINQPRNGTKEGKVHIYYDPEGKEIDGRDLYISESEGEHRTFSQIEIKYMTGEGEKNHSIEIDDLKIIEK